MKTSLLLASAAVLGLFAAPALADEHGAENAEEKICIQSNRIRNFDGLDDQHVFVEQRTKEYFLLTMRYRCTGLRNAQAIGLKDVTSRICSGGFGEIVYRERGIGPNRCRIETIERVENKDEARAIIAEREQYKKDQEAHRKAEKKKKKEMEKAAKEAATETVED